MPCQKLTGPCAVHNCNNLVKSYRNVIQANQDQICFECYMNIVNFVASQVSKNTIPATFIDLGDIIEYSKIISNNSNVPINYLKCYEEHQYIDFDLNNFSNIKMKMINDGIFIDQSNFNKLIYRIINQKIQDNNLIQTLEMVNSRN
ncbi:25246_t:CDS:2, partial [Gigaspora margarita]